MHHLNNTQKWLCVMLACLLSLSPVNGAQADTPPTSLEIVVVQGEGAIHKIGDREGEEPIVEIRDQNKHPLTGAAVVFTLPVQGTSGEFGNGAKSLTVLTDENGRATANSLRINQIAGKLQIHVNASYKGQTARAIITQFNMAGPGGAGKSAKSGSTKLLIILAVIGAAAAGGVVAGTRKGGSSSGGSTPGSPANTAIGITAGTGTVGPP